MIDRNIPANLQAYRDIKPLKPKETTMANAVPSQCDRNDKLIAPTPTPKEFHIRSVKPTGVSDPADEQFDAFWRAYPSRGGHSNPKKPARDRFAAAIKRGVDPALIIQAAENYSAFVKRKGTLGQHIAQAMTWLVQCRWEQYNALEESEMPVAGMI
jgi:hypothetical protein